ncbi:hypothetical protein GQX74_015504 [Glossina fuscipes]|nr:hypothetical protein GQX74_015504 [Glossina fuscipes]
MICNRETSSTTIATEIIMPIEKAVTQVEATATIATVTKVTPTNGRSSSSSSLLPVSLQSTLNDSANLGNSSVHKVIVATGGILSNSTRTCLLTNPSPKILKKNTNNGGSNNDASGCISSECSYAQPQQQQQQHAQQQQQQQQQQHSRQLVSMNPETAAFLSNNITNFLATTTKTATRRTITIPFNANAKAIATTNQVTTFFSNSTYTTNANATTTTTSTTTNASKSTENNRNNSTSRHNINSYTYVDDERNADDDNDKTKLAQVLSTTRTKTTTTTTTTSSSLSYALVENTSASSIVKSTDFVMSNETFHFTPSLIRYQADGNIFLRFPRSLTSGKSSAATGSDDTGLKMFGVSGSSSITNMFNPQTATGFNGNSIIECPSFDESSACPCYKFEDGLFLECPGTTAISLRSTLERISSPIHSLSIYDFDRSVTSLSQDVFQPGVNIRHLQFSHSHLETLKDNSLKNVRASLESLSIVNGKLTQHLYGFNINSILERNDTTASCESHAINKSPLSDGCPRFSQHKYCSSYLHIAIMLSFSFLSDNLRFKRSTKISLLRNINATEY